MKHRCIVKSMALKFLMGLIVCVWLDSDVRAQGGGEIQNPPCCSLSISEVVDFILPISVDNSVANPPRFITCPNTNPPVAAWCTKSTKPLQSNKTPCDIYGGSPTFGIVGNVRYDCFAQTTLDFCDGKFAGVELKKTDGTWGFCAPKASSETTVSPRAESPILGYAEGDFYRFSCQPNAAENSECDYVKDPAKTRYPYLAVKEGEPDAKKGECVTRPDFACTLVMGHGRRWKDPTCRSAHGARTPPAWNSADLGQYTGAVKIGTKEKHGNLFYSHTGMPARVKVCMPKSAGGTGGGGGGGGGGGNGGGNTIACTLGPCGGKTNGVPNGCPGVSVSTPTGCGCSSDGKPPCNGGGTGGSNGGGSSGGGGTTGGAGSGGSGSGGGNGGNGSDGSGGRVCPTITCPRGQQQNPLTCACEPSNNGGSNGGGPSAGGGANGNNGTGGGAPAGGGITVVIIPPSDNPLERLSGGRGNPVSYGGLSSGGAQGFSGGGAPPAVSGGAPAGAGGSPNFDRSRR